MVSVPARHRIRKVFKAVQGLFLAYFRAGAGGPQLRLVLRHRTQHMQAPIRGGAGVAKRGSLKSCWLSAYAGSNPVRRIMKQATLCLLLRDSPEPQVLMGFKKTSLGKGYYNFPGGKKASTDLTMEACAARELYEEMNVRVAREVLVKKGELTFQWPKQLSERDQVVHVYVTHVWSGDPVETLEMKPLWAPLANMPYENMWAADKIWVPHVLQGAHVTGRFSYNKRKELIEKQVRLRDTIAAKRVYRS